MPYPRIRCLNCGTSWRPGRDTGVRRCPGCDQRIHAIADAPASSSTALKIALGCLVIPIVLLLAIAGIGVLAERSESRSEPPAKKVEAKGP